ncbi:hypothetical protein Trydic_g10930 [Trypoxylus dichotomus]
MPFGPHSVSSAPKKESLNDLCRWRDLYACFGNINGTHKHEIGQTLSRECSRKCIYKPGLSFYKAKDKPLLTDTQKINWFD